MNSAHKIGSALISVFDKDGLAPIIKKLDALGVTLYSTWLVSLWHNHHKKD